MSPKKPYQKRLPAVLPPAPRRRPQQESLPRRAARPPVRPPGPPTPRAVPEVATPPERVAEPVPHTAADPGVDPGAPAAPTSAPSPRTPEPAPRAKQEPTPELLPAAGPPQATASPVAPPPPRDAVTKALWVLVAVGVALVGVVVAVVVGGGVTGQVDDAEDPSAAPPSSFRTDGWPAAGVSRTVTEVRAGGDLEVTHWIHADRPLDELVLALPELGDEEVEVTEVDVVADGRPGPAPRPVAPVGAAYSFDDARRIQVRYRLLGAVQPSSSAEGRGLATTTSLTITPAQPRDVRVVLAQEVLSLSCASPGQEPAPCGESGGEDQWRVELSGDDTVDRVLAEVTIPS